MSIGEFGGVVFLVVVCLAILILIADALPGDVTR
jgi:hypothetical protein